VSKGKKPVPFGGAHGLANGSGSSAKRPSSGVPRSSFELDLAPNADAEAPIDSQGVVNIAGVKYLVVPNTAVTKAVEEGDGGKLSLLLQPSSGDSTLPAFEVEQGPDGSLLLVPLGDAPLTDETKARLLKRGASGANHVRNQMSQVRLLYQTTPSGT